MNIVILAAGQGKRMQSALPKVLHPVAGEPMLSHVLRTARELAPQQVVVVIGHGADQLRAAYAQRDEARGVIFALQTPQRGTGHAVAQALPHLDEAVPTLVLYGDVPLVRSQSLVQLANVARAAAQGDGDAVAVLSAELVDPSGYGRIVRDEHGAVHAIVEDKDADAQQRRIQEINTGILIAPTRALRVWLERLSDDNAQREYYLTDIVAQARAAAVPVVAVKSDEPQEVMGVNSKVELGQVERVAQARVAQRLMQAGAQLADPARIDVRGELTVGADVFIDVGNVFEGRVHLADGVHIGPNNVIRNCVLGADTQVLGFCYLESAQIGARGRIGPYARTRPQVVLGDEVHLGNFVEVKNSQLGDGAKANHLAYVGDARLGRRVNIGAGTIVANYDGANKHPTVIEDDVHTGSNSVLVAPITVGAGATIGAGSTVTGEVEAGKLTVARAKQLAVPGWKRPVKHSKTTS
ncbi:MAG TPA: bifunctional UDP-N-acetylglucosamine diphosphorylase/glucosamine-1-phosphate N-acetyltransferase GlmU [Burkholderiaceae bacterium]|nr:bifunctional UDP-N-acetylglucosamine diphosphorylase/glucosamine-1-phosphate N-acetyltransferase GlmU [Burkholderiaceae bacterium]